ncbi:hypothetical protein Bphy_0265 [Paraburkholderia phymatum STM815]|uniref:Uncharacterized protein n=1 Tax=Paraburkholderia phymatum (strain DSM 17167 / CIP 108236 / LMG 21445 / STM815) TaxID=391038 RepID=B2JC94_PARP8|nr:hypothetical protein Bphy_0265 [Paraburkholderia phymatum STM815]
MHDECALADTRSAKKCRRAARETREMKAEPAIPLHAHRYGLQPRTHQRDRPCHLARGRMARTWREHVDQMAMPSGIGAASLKRTCRDLKRYRRGSRS